MEDIKKIKLHDELKERESQILNGSNGLRRLPPSGSGSGSGDDSGSGSGDELGSGNLNFKSEGIYKFGDDAVTVNEDDISYTWYISCKAEWKAVMNNGVITLTQFNVTIIATSTYDELQPDNTILRKTITEKYDYLDMSYPFEWNGRTASKICDNINLVMRYVVKDEKTQKCVQKSKTFEKRGNVSMSLEYDSLAAIDKEKIVPYDGHVVVW